MTEKKKPNWYAIISLTLGLLTAGLPLVIGIKGCVDDRKDEVVTSNMIEQRIAFPSGGGDVEYTIDKSITIRKKTNK